MHTFGDSTMAEYDTSATDQRGWGMYLGDYMAQGWRCANHAVCGYDSRRGYDTAWERN